MKESIDNYNALDHPVQKRALSVLEEFMQLDAFALPKGIDGCNIPAFAFPLKNIALGMSCLSPKTTRLSPARKKIIAHIVKVMGAESLMVGGSSSFDSKILKELKEKRNYQSWCRWNICRSSF